MENMVRSNRKFCEKIPTYLYFFLLEKSPIIYLTNKAQNWYHFLFSVKSLLLSIFTPNSSLLFLKPQQWPFNQTKLVQSFPTFTFKLPIISHFTNTFFQNLPPAPVWSTHDVQLTARRVAAGLHNIVGIKKGDVVMSLLPNSPRLCLHLPWRVLPGLHHDSMQPILFTRLWKLIIDIDKLKVYENKNEV